jgi:glycosyltransferase involved in cell wall biosynthesis
VSSSSASLPLVSYLMLTRDRLRLAERAIGCYQNQRYPHRELVIVCQGDSAYQDEVRRHIDQTPIAHARLIAAGPQLQLGALRNISLDEARGDLVCIWDDDDCSHPDRLVRQVDHLLETDADAVFLSGSLHLFEADGVLHWLDMSVRPERQLPLVPGTMVMRRDDRFRYPETGQYAHCGEDEQLAVDLFRHAKVAMMGDVGLLYLYTYHGDNTFSRQHHLRMRRYSLPSSSIRARAGEIRDALAQYPIAKPVAVHGREGPVFTVDS